MAPPPTPPSGSMEGRIVQNIRDLFEQFGKRKIDGSHKIIRIRVNATDYKKKWTLPKETVIWRIVNNGDTDVRWATNDRPPDEGEASYSTLPARSADLPPLAPFQEGKPIDLWFRNEGANQNIVITLAYTTSNDPRAIAQFATLSLGLNASDISLGAVELEDHSSEVRVSITSGADGIAYIETDASGATVNLGATSGPLRTHIADPDNPEIMVDITSGADGIKRMQVVAQITSAEIQIGAIELKDGSADQRVTVTSGPDGVKYIETDVSGSLVAVNQTSGPFRVEIQDRGDGAVRLDLTSGSDGITYIETDASGAFIRIGNTVNSSGVSVVAVDPGAAEPAAAGSVGLVTASRLFGANPSEGNLFWATVDALAPAINATPYGLATIAGMYGQRGSSPEEIAMLRVTSGTDGVVYMETDVSGSRVVAGGLRLGGSTVTPFQTNTSGVQYAAPIADSTGGLLFSGVATFTSGATSGTGVLLSFGAPAIRDDDAEYIIDVYTGALSTDIKVVVNRSLFYNSNQRNVEVGTFTVPRLSSGVSQVVQGIFAGGVSGQLNVSITLAAIENVSAEINIYRAGG